MVNPEPRPALTEVEFSIISPGPADGQAGPGLAVVKRSVELYGGRVWVESRLGEGSKFSFTYPKQMPQPEQPVMHKSSPTNEGAAP